MEKPGMVNRHSFHIGVDLGQRVDHTGVVVVEQQVVVGSVRNPVTYEYGRERRMVVRMVERVKLGQGFQEIVSEVERLTQAAEFATGQVTTTVDATGMGVVVTEDLRRRKLRGELYPVVITGGLEGKYQSGFYPTPRTELLLGVQKAFEQQGMEVARGLRQWPALQEEMMAMRKVQSVRGPRFETLGRHDDLVFALALALFGLRQRVLPVDPRLLRLGAGW